MAEQTKHLTNIRTVVGSNVADDNFFNRAQYFNSLLRKAISL